MWHGSDQSVALLRHYWAFSSSGLLDWLFLIFLLKISHRFHMGFRSGMLAGQSSTVISWSAKHLEVFVFYNEIYCCIFNRPTTLKIQQYISSYTWGTFFSLCSPNPSWVFAAKKLIFLVSSEHRSQSHLKFQSCLITEYAGDCFWMSEENFSWNPPEQHVVM